MLLVVDNGSVYTKNLIDFLTEKKIQFNFKKHNDVKLSEIENYSSFILSGRRKNNQEMNALNSKIIKHAASKQKNLLGICYGAEILALTIGGTIKKKNVLEKGIQDINIIKQNPLCSGTIKAFESHNYEISRINSSLINLASSKNCLYEIIQLSNSNIFGTQFHPEMSLDGQKIIESFLSL